MRAVGIIFLIIVAVAVATGAYVWYSLNHVYGTIPQSGVFVTVPRGSSQRAVSQILKRSGVIRSAFSFELYARRHVRRNLQAGDYMFDHPMTGKEVFWKLANGEVYQQPFTVREGETMFDIAQELQDAKYLTREEFLTAAKDPALILDIAPEAHTLEGFLFPATYNLPRNGTAKELTTAMVRKFREAWQQISPPKSAPDSAGATALPVLRIVTLASLVERETPKAAERPLVAGVYTNRLNKSMLLQCDPTVIYALEQVGRYRGSLTLKDLRYDSPYNTYLFPGLPPGPIGNPGEESLKAAVKPAETNYLYFVANTQGGHFFASSLAEHNQNVIKYHHLLKSEAAAKASTAQEVPVASAPRPDKP